MPFSLNKFKRVVKLQAFFLTRGMGRPSRDPGGFCLSRRCVTVQDFAYLQMRPGRKRTPLRTPQEYVTFFLSTCFDRLTRLQVRGTKAFGHSGVARMLMLSHY
jgi:hypothetical protein